MEKYIQSYLTLDTRRVKHNGTYPVKLRIYNSLRKKAKYYSIGIDMTEDEYSNTWLSKKPKSQVKEMRNILQTIEKRATDIIKQIDPFTFTRFETKFFRKSTDGTNMIYHFNQKIESLIDQGRIGTSESYKQALISLCTFASIDKDQLKTSYLSLLDIDEKWLDEYEKSILAKNRSISTVGIYLRSLRVIFNAAIASGDVDSIYYPFGKGKYIIPSSKRVKKALNKEQLGALFNAKTSNNHQVKARDFFFLSYACNGINLVDIAKLRYENIQNDSIRFVRTKTARSKRNEQVEISIPLNSFAQGIIDKYKSVDSNKRALIFDIIDDSFSAIENRKRIKNFIRYINQHLSNLAKANGVKSDISFYFARHSFATNAIKVGASMELISEALGHSNMNTTVKYFAGFEDETKKEIADKLMNFT